MSEPIGSNPHSSCAIREIPRAKQQCSDPSFEVARHLGELLK